jgi:hypothetical protein
MSADQPRPPAGTKMQVHLPGGIEPIYANFALITHSASEIVIDLAQVMPQVAQARIRARVVMTALNAKLLLRALTDHMARFEEQFGEVRVPEGSSLADQLFRSGSDKPGEEE